MSETPLVGQSGSLVNSGILDGNEYPTEMDCPITQSLMLDPVTASDGHTYERSAIQYWFDTGHNRSPVTNETVPSQSLYSNYALRKIIQYRRQKLGQALVELCSHIGESGCFENVKALLVQKADVNCRDESGNTPIILGAASGQVNLVEELITYGANILKTNTDGKTALDIAREVGDDQVISLVQEETESQQNRLEIENSERLERRRRREETDRMGEHGGQEEEDAGPEEPLFPHSVGNWTIDHGRGFFPSLFALQYQHLKVSDAAEASQPESHVSQQHKLTRVVCGLCCVVLTCMVLF